MTQNCKSPPEGRSIPGRVFDSDREGRVQALLQSLHAAKNFVLIRRNFVANHAASNKHKFSKEKLASRESKERDITTFLDADDALTHFLS